MSELTGRQRLLRVFHQQPVDRIPVAPFIHVNFVKEFYGSHEVDWVVHTPEVYRHFGFDIIHRNCTPAPDIYGPSGPDWELEVIRKQNGRDETVTTMIHTPVGTLRCVEALRWVYEYDAENSLIEYPIKSESDLEIMMRFQPPPIPPNTEDIQRAKAAVGDDGIIAPWIQGAFNLVAFYYRRLDDLLLDALSNPTFYNRLMSYAIERYKTHIQAMSEAGVDVFSYGGNIANARLVGPEFFARFVLPYERQLIEFIQSYGVAVLYHNCGRARKLLPLYPTLGMRAYESLTPPPYGDTILAEAVEIFGQKITLSGNIDQIDLLRHGSADEIRTQVRQVLDTVRGRAHFILATTDYFNENTPHDNIYVFAEAGREYGIC
ncbi:MAG: uroporphyrinogen decarboxylase family protein [Anaerolineae bacterium]